MRRYEYVINIKASLFIFGIILIISFLYYTRTLISELREDNKEIVRLYAGVIADVVKDDSNVNLDFIFENIIKKVKFPVIQTDNNMNIQMWKNLPKPINATNAGRLISLQDKAKESLGGV